MYIVGVSRLFFIVWRMVRPWLDAHTASKITFLTSEDAAVALHEAIDPSQLPHCYGGVLTAPWDDAAAAATGGGGGGDSAAATPPGTPYGSGAALSGLAGTPSGGVRAAGVLAAAGSAPPTPPRGGGATPPPPGREGSPMRRRGHGSSRGGSIDFGPSGSLMMPPAGAGAAGGGHARGHSRSTSADLTQRRSGTPLGFYAAPSGGGGPGHRRMVSEDAMSMVSWASAMSMDDSDNEFFDAVDLYVEARLAEVEDAAAAASGTAGGGIVAKADAAGGGIGAGIGAGTARRGAARRMTFDLSGTGGGGGARGAGGAAAAGVGGLEPIPEHRVISEVRGRLNRVRLLLDSTNVLTCIAGVVLIAYGDAPFEPQTLKVFGGVIMTVSLVSIIAGLAVSISAVSLCICARDCLFGPRVRERTETEEGIAEGEEEGDTAV
jgi:hypothetical protein